MLLHIQQEAAMRSLCRVAILRCDVSSCKLPAQPRMRSSSGTAARRTYSHNPTPHQTLYPDYLGMGLVTLKGRKVVGLI